MATPDAAATAAMRCSPSFALQVSNDGARVMPAQLPPTTLQVLQPPPIPRESTASHAMRCDLPRIVAANATSHPPPSLNSCRTAAARGPDSAPALWYWQLTGEEWLGDSHSYELAKKAWRRMPAEHKAAERDRDRSGRKRPADDSAKAAQRVRVKREAEKREAATAYRVVDMHTYVSADGHVHLLVAPSEVAASRLEPVAAERASCETAPTKRALSRRCASSSSP